MLKGKVFCGDCLVPAMRMGTNYKGADGKKRVYRYRCRTYQQKGKRECTLKSIAEKGLEKIVYQAIMGFLWQMERPEEALQDWSRKLLQKERSSIETEKRMEEGNVRRAENEKIRLYIEYSRKHQEGGRGRKEWYLKEKCKRDEEIRYYEIRKAELEKKIAFCENLETGDGKRMQGFFAGELNAQMVSVFVDRIMLYEGKRVEMILNFNGRNQ